MRMEVTVTAMRMCHHHWNWVASKSCSLQYGVYETANINEAKQNEHQADRKLHAEPQTYRDRQTENNDGDSQGNDREGVPRAPTNPNQSRTRDLVLPRDDGRNCDYMIGICSMADPEEKTDREDGDTAEHARVSRV